MDWGEKVTGKYKVKSGDNLTSISSVLGIPTDSLQAFNNIKNPDKIQVGQELLWRRDPSIIESALRWAFESDEDTQKSRDINNKIQSNINRVVPIIDPEYESLKRTIFKNKDIKNFSNVMSKIYTKVLTDLSLPLHNVPNLVRQDALESSYGTSTRGNGYNLGGVKVFIDKEKLGTKYKDGFYYRNFNDLEDYARYKVNLLENDYGGIISSPASEFIDRLHGNNPGKKNYSANKKHYINSFKGMKTLDSYLNELKQGGRFTFKKNRLVKNAEQENKRDLRKKLVKSNIPNSTKNKAKKYQAGGELVDLPNIVGIGNGSWNTGVLGSGIMSAEDGIKVPEIKIDPSIFTSWNSIHSDLVIPDIEYFTPVDTSFTDNLSKSIILQDNKKEEKSTKKEVKKEKSKEQPKIVSSHYIYNNKDKWASDLTESYKRAGITNQEALRYLLAQDALESGWGKSAQGNFNYGNLTTGSSWKGNYVQGRDKDSAGNPISQKFRSYNSMDEYTKDKINFLTRLYDFNQDDDFQTFISKLTGSNKGHRRYAEARNYGESLTKVFQSLIDKHQGGGALNWTSEDLHNPVYKKGWTPESDKKALKNIKKGIQETRNKNFERNANIAYGIARLIPGPVGLATDITDIGYELYKNKSLPDSSTDAVKFGSWLLKRKLGRGIDLVNEMAKDMFGGYQKVANTVDTVQDSKQLYNTVNKHQEGGTLLFGNPETSEMLTYKMNDGSIKTVPNTGAGFVSGTDPIGATVVEGAVLNKPLDWTLGKAIKWARNLLGKSKGKEYTERLIKALGDKYKGRDKTEIFTADQNYFLDYLESLGVDISKFGNSDIRRLQNLRRKTILESIPENERVSSVEFLKNATGTSLDINLNKSKDVIGNISGKVGKEGIDIGFVENYRPLTERGVSEDLYNSAITIADQTNSPGVISGRRLLSPEQTYKIWNRFSNKKLISKEGKHSFNTGENVKRNGNSYTINNGNIYLLQSPSKKIKTKASNVFNPFIIDDIFKTLVPMYLYGENNK